MQGPSPTRQPATEDTRLVLMCGLPGAGKTTVARHLADQMEAVRFSPDEWLVCLGFDGYDEEARQRIETLQWELAQKFLLSGRSVILESGFWTRKDRDEKRQRARQLGCAVELRFLDVPVADLWDRLAFRNAGNPNTGLPVERHELLAWAEEFETPDQEELTLFDPPTDSRAEDSTDAQSAPDIQPHHWDSAVEQNRRAWEEIAELRADRYPDSKVPAESFATGGSILDERVVEAVGDVRGQRLLHLMCSTGEETLSWANMGARAVGVDFSGSNIALAEEKARRAMVAVEFVKADVGALPPRLARRSFDLVYSATGVMVWVPDLDRWAKSIASALRPGGRFVLWEEHPLWYTLAVEDGKLRVVGDYFRRGEPIVSSGWDHFHGGDDAAEEKQQFVWPLGDIVNALGAERILVERLDEFPTESAWRLGEHLEGGKRLPGLVLLVARKV